MNGNVLDAFLSYMKENYPSFYKSIERNRMDNSQLFADFGGKATNWASGALGASAAKSLADGYCHFVTDVNREQLSYCARGAYRNKTYAEVYASVYNNDEYMGLYHWGVYATLFLWEHHLRLYEFFRDRFLALPASGANIIELGSGSGVWSILSATSRPDITCTGVDISKSSLAIASALALAAGADDRVRFQVGDGLNYQGQQQYQAGISCFLLEHLEEPGLLIANMHRNIEPGAPLFITAAITAAEVDHIYEFRSETEVLKLIEDQGFRIIEVLSATPKEDKRLTFLPRSIGVIAKKKIGAHW